MDSLLAVLRNAKEDTNRVNTLNELSNTLIQNYDTKSAIIYSDEAILLAGKIDFKKGQATAYAKKGGAYFVEKNYTEALKNFMTSLGIRRIVGDKTDIGYSLFSIGMAYEEQNNYIEAQKNYTEALNLTKETGNQFQIAQLYKYIGHIYQLVGNNAEALKNFYTSLSFSEKIEDKEGMSLTLQFIGAAYGSMGNDSAALKNSIESLRIREEIGDRWGIAQSYNTIGGFYTKQGKYTEAMEKHLAALKIFKEPGMPDWGIPFTYESIATVYAYQADSASAAGNRAIAAGKYNLSLDNYFAALELHKKNGLKSGVAQQYFNLGAINIKLNNNSLAKENLKNSLRLALEIRYQTLIFNNYFRLSLLDSMEGNYKQAYEHYKMFILYRDSVINQENTRKAEDYRMQYEFDKKDDQIKLLSTENKLKTALAAKEGQRKNFAYIGIAAIALIGGYGFYRYRRRRRIQSQQSLMKERLRISRELHDEVGATLSGIAMYSHLAKEQIKNQQSTEIEKSLNIMQQSSGEMVNKLNDIVWLINPDQDSLQKLVQRLEEYARDMATIKNMQVKVTVPEKIAGINLPMENRRNIYLFCKEAINNAVKYSNGSLLELRINEKDGKLEFSVSDNGKGFDAVMVRRGNGLENMQKRADEIGAKLILSSRQNEGAVVALQCEIGR